MNGQKIKLQCLCPAASTVLVLFLSTIELTGAIVCWMVRCVCKMLSHTQTDTLPYFVHLMISFPTITTNFSFNSIQIFHIRHFGSDFGRARINYGEKQLSRVSPYNHFK